MYNTYLYFFGTQFIPSCKDLYFHNYVYIPSGDKRSIEFTIGNFKARVRRLCLGQIKEDNMRFRSLADRHTFTGYSSLSSCKVSNIKSYFKCDSISYFLNTYVAERDGRADYKDPLSTFLL